jgi:hypothetical protein
MACDRGVLPPFHLIHGEHDKSVPLRVALAFAEALKVLSFFALSVALHLSFMFCLAIRFETLAGLLAGTRLCRDSHSARGQIAHAADDRGLASGWSRQNGRADSGNGALRICHMLYSSVVSAGGISSML